MLETYYAEEVTEVRTAIYAGADADTVTSARAAVAGILSGAGKPVDPTGPPPSSAVPAADSEEAMLAQQRAEQMLGGGS